MIKAVIIDFDGVICDSNKVHVISWKHVFSELGEPFDEEYYGYQLQGLNKILGIKKILRDFNHEDEDLNQIVSLRDKKMDELYKDINNFTLNQNILSFIDKNKRKDIKFILYSGSSRVRKVLEMHDIQDKFYYVVDIKKEFKDKGEFTNYLKICDKFDVLPSECAGIDDSPIAISAMNKAGLVTIGIGKYTKNISDVNFERVELFNINNLNDIRSKK